MRILSSAIAALVVGLASSAYAADLPVKAPAPAPVMAPVWNWNGFYIGINGGYSWGHSSRDLNFFNPLNGVLLATGTGQGRDMNGGLFGGQIGYNWQMSNWVFGLEADAQWTGQKGSTTVLCPVGGCFPATTVAPLATGGSAALSDKLDWFATFRGRLGFTVTPNVLLYATGGAAWGEVETSVGLTALTAAGVPVTALGTNKTDRFGWTIGGGIEAMFAANWSAKIEYLYLDMGSISNSVVMPVASGIPLGANVTSRVTDNIIRAGINYHFSAGPGY
jgi:outer membrane immunogenic protein